jgi:hypothetical protein
MENETAIQPDVSDQVEQAPESPEEADQFRNLAEDPILAKDALEFCKDLWGTLKRKRKPFESVWVECNQAFRCVEGVTWFQGSAPYCSSDLRDAVLSIVPKIAKAIWYQDIPFDLIPQGTEGDDDKLVDINKSVLSWDFRNLHIYLKYVDSLFQKAIFGTNIVKTPPHFQEITKHLREWAEQSYGGQSHLPKGKVLNRSKATERMFMGTDFVVTDLLDFWIDPATVSRGMDDAVEYGDCYESIIVKKTDLERGQAKGIYTDLGDVEDYYIGGKTPRGAQDNSERQRMRAAGHMGTSVASGSGSNENKKARGNKAYELKEHYVEFDLAPYGYGNGVERLLMTTCADKKVVRIQKWPDAKPYLSSRYIPNGYNKEFYGTGIIETNLANHYERNATRKQILAARTLGLNMEMLSDQTGFQNRPDKLRTAPNKIHFVKSIAGVKPLEKPIGQILQSGIAWETNLKAETQQSSGNTPYVQGADTSKINDTASGIAQLTQAGNEKFTLPLQVDETGILEPYVMRCLENNITYRTESFVIRLTDKKPLRVEPDQLSASFDVYCNGSTELQNKQLRQAGLMKAWEIALGAVQIEASIYGQPLTKFPELKKEIFANLGLSKPESFLIDIKDLQGEMPILSPDMEWVLLRRMADGVTPLMPLMIQPGEDYKDHYEKHVAKTLTDEFRVMPDPVKQIWMAHIVAYQKVLKQIEDRNREKVKAEEVEHKEVAVGG